MIQEIKSLDQDYVLKCSSHELEDYYVDKYMYHPVNLMTDKASRSIPYDIEIDVSHEKTRYFSPGTPQTILGTEIVIQIPYTGGGIGFWKASVNRYSSMRCDKIHVDNNNIYFPIRFADEIISKDNIEKHIQSTYDSIVVKLNTKINELNQKMEEYNNKLRDAARNQIQYLKERAESIQKIVISLLIPMHRDENPPIIPMNRKQRPVTLPSVAATSYEPEPIVEEREYEYILDTLRNLSMAMERTPSFWKNPNEEDIRNLFLVHLNGHYKGGATGETFNASGKTDILVRENGRNAFIAECKIWNGPAAFDKAVTQLLSYLTWRDSKCAIIIFNKNRNTSAVYGKYHQVMTSREEHVRTIRYTGEHDSRYVFVKKDEPGREITITVQVYDIPS